MSKVPVIVTMSGKLDIEKNESMTAQDVFDLVGKRFGVTDAKVVEPFVVVHNQILSKYRTVEDDEVIGEVDGIREVIRVVLPLGDVE